MSKSKNTSKPSQGLGNRLVDVLLIVWWITFLFTVTFTDLHNFVASYHGVPTSALKNMTLSYPPKALTDVYFKWAETLDPLLLENPTWWQAMEWVNLLFLAPSALVFIVAYFVGCNCVRNWSIIVSSFTMYSVVLCIFATVYGENRSPDIPMFLGVYVPYIIFPILVIIRNWSEKPFTTPMGGLRASFIGFVGTATFAVFLSYSLKWFFIHMSEIPTAYLGEDMYRSMWKQLMKLP